MLFPSHDPDPARLVSVRARDKWRRYKCYVEPFRAERFVPAEARDISGGLWRKLMYRSELEYPAVQPQHERRKYLAEERLWKFLLAQKPTSVWECPR